MSTATETKLALPPEHFVGPDPGDWLTEKVAVFGEIHIGDELADGIPVQSFEQAYKASLSKPPFWVERYVLITPEDAWNIINGRRMEHERLPMKYTWKKYAASMRRELFYGPLHTIKFSVPVYGDESVPDGVEPLFDGQHRLLAVYNTKAPQLFHMQFNVPKEAHPHIDTPRVRPGYSALGFRGDADVKLLYRLATRALILQGGRRVFNGHFKPIIEDVMHIIDQGGVTEATRWAKAFRGSHLANDTAVGTAAYVILSESRADALGERVEDFFTLLLRGAGEGWGEDNPIWVLRDRLIQDWGKKGKLSENTHRQLHFILMTWNHWVRGTYAQQLRTPEGSAPLPLAA